MPTITDSLYDFLVQHASDMPDKVAFNKTLQDKGKREELHKFMNQHFADVPDFQTFDTLLGSRDMTFTENAGRVIGEVVQTVQKIPELVQHGWTQGQIDTEINHAVPDAEKVATLIDQQKDIKPTKTQQRAQTPSETIIPGGFIENPVSWLTELFFTSASTMLPQVLERAPENLALGMVAGAAIGTAYGTPVLGVGALPGAIAGVVLGAGTAIPISLDQASKVQAQSELLLGKLKDVYGVDINNHDELVAALSDTKLINKIKGDVYFAAETQGFFDGIAATFGGGIAKTVINKFGSGFAAKVVGEMGEFAFQAASGMAGEAGKQVITSGKVTSPADVVAEGLGEMPSVGIPARVGKAAIRKVGESIKFTSNTGDQAHFNRLNPDFRTRFEAMAEEYKQKTGKKLQVNSAARSNAEQQAIYDSGVRPAAKPGKSRHNRGAAVDVGRQNVADLSSLGLLEKYGFETGAAFGDPNHIQDSGETVDVQSLDMLPDDLRAQYEETDAVVNPEPVLAEPTAMEQLQSEFVDAKPLEIATEPTPNQPEVVQDAEVAPENPQVAVQPAAKLTIKEALLALKAIKESLSAQDNVAPQDAEVAPEAVVNPYYRSTQTTSFQSDPDAVVTPETPARQENVAPQVAEVISETPQVAVQPKANPTINESLSVQQNVVPDEVKSIEKKEPWQMTKNEFDLSGILPDDSVLSEIESRKPKKRRGISGNLPALSAYENSLRKWVTEYKQALKSQHKRIVEQAIDEGKPVPVEVLVDYPELQSSMPSVSAQPESITVDDQNLGRPGASTYSPDQQQGDSTGALTNQEDLSGSFKKTTKSTTYSISDSVPDQNQATAGTFNMVDRVLALKEKYAKRISEKGAGRYRGKYDTKTKSIMVRSLRNLTDTAHEISHYITDKYSIDKKVLSGNYGKIVNEIINVYEKYYGDSQPLLTNDRTKVVEGISTFIEAYIIDPVSARKEFPELTKAIILNEGAFSDGILSDFLKDARKIVNDYHALDSNGKIGSAVTSNNRKVGGKAIFSWFENIGKEIADNISPIERIGKIAGTAWSKADPSLHLRQFLNISRYVLHNIKDGITFMVFENGDLVEKEQFNYGTLGKEIEKAGDMAEFDNWLVARLHVKGRELLGKMIAEYNQSLSDIQSILSSGIGNAKEKFDEAQAFIDGYDRLKSVLDNDDIDIEVAIDAYNKDAKRFKHYADKFDALQKATNNMMADADIQLLTPELRDLYAESEGYVTMKRSMYDEIGGEPGEPTTLGGTSRVSSYLTRTGSGKEIISPFYSTIKNHAEAFRKGMKQVVYNKLGDIFEKNPELFPAQKEEGDARLFANSKDHIIAMDNYTPVAWKVGREIKDVVDQTLDYKKVHKVESVLRASNRLFQMGTTAMYVAFAATNIVMDQFVATMNSRTGVYVPLLTPINILVRRFANHSSPEAVYAREYFLLGGERQTFAHWQDLSPSEFFDKVYKEKSAFKHAATMVWKYSGGGVVNTLKWLGEKSEIMTRSAEYVKARKLGYPQIAALELAGRVTTPFHHTGRLGGGTVGESAIRSITFFNPQIQALAQFTDTLSRPDGRAKVAFVTAAITVAGVSGVLAICGGGSDEQKRILKGKTPEELAMYMYFPHPTDPNKVVNIRVPQEINTIATMINMVMMNDMINSRYTAGEYLDGATAWIPDQLNPLDPTRQFFSLMPQAIKTSVELSTNTRTFPKVMPIDTYWEERYKEPRFRTTERTSEIAKYVGAKFNVSPKKIDYAILGYGSRGLTQFSLSNIRNPFERELYMGGVRQMHVFYNESRKFDELKSSIKNGWRVPADEALMKQTEKQIKSVNDAISEYSRVPTANKERLKEARAKVLDAIDTVDYTAIGKIEESAKVIDMPEYKKPVKEKKINQVRIPKPPG